MTEAGGKEMALPLGIVLKRLAEIDALIETLKMERTALLRLKSQAYQYGEVGK